jgi:hypothetical protein
MLIPANVVSGLSFKHGPAEVSASIVAPVEFGTAGQVPVATLGIRALIMQAAPSATNTGQIRHGVLLVLGAVLGRRD